MERCLHCLSRRTTFSCHPCIGVQQGCTSDYFQASSFSCAAGRAHMACSFLYQRVARRGEQERCMQESSVVACIAASRVQLNTRMQWLGTIQISWVEGF
jgi:hypothetical protein